METPACPLCRRPYGKRRRCYHCKPPRQKTGETRSCLQCGASFYVAGYEVRDVERGTGKFCSYACKGEFLRGKPVPWARPEEETEHSAGYLEAWAPEHPRAHAGRVLAHIPVMEGKLGRPLEPGEFVHHKDLNKQNNDPDNLQLVGSAEHGRIHATFNRALVPPRRVTLICEECGQPFEVVPYKANPESPEFQRFCSRSCVGKVWERATRAKRGRAPD